MPVISDFLCSSFQPIAFKADLNSFQVLEVKGMHTMVRIYFDTFIHIFVVLHLQSLNVVWCKLPGAPYSPYSAMT